MVIRKAIPVPIVDRKDLPPMTVNQAAAALGMSTEGVHKAIREDRLDALQNCDGKFFILKSDAKKFAKKTDRKFVMR